MQCDAMRSGADPGLRNAIEHHLTCLFCRRCKNTHIELSSEFAGQSGQGKKELKYVFMILEDK